MAFGPEGGVWESVGEEGGHDAGFRDDFVGEHAVADLDGGDEAARVDFVEIPFFAGAVEGDDDFGEGEVETFEGYVGAVGPGAAVVGVECYWEGGLVEEM